MSYFEESVMEQQGCVQSISVSLFYALWVICSHTAFDLGQMEMSALKIGSLKCHYVLERIPDSNSNIHRVKVREYDQFLISLPSEC